MTYAEIKQGAVQTVVEHVGKENIENQLVDDEFVIPQGTVFRIAY